jgi:hypothetical protein
MNQDFFHPAPDKPLSGWRLPVLFKIFVAFLSESKP